VTWWKLLLAAGRPRAITNPQAIQELITRYRDNKEPINALAFEYGISAASLRTILKENNVPIRTIQEVNRGGQKRRRDFWTTQDNPKLVEYVKDKISRGYEPKALAKVLNMTPFALMNLMKRNNIEPDETPTYPGDPAPLPQPPTPNPNRLKGVKPTAKVKVFTIPEWVENFIRANPNQSPSFYYMKTHHPIGAIVKFLIENNFPMHYGNLRYVPRGYAEKYWQTNPSATPQDYANWSQAQLSKTPSSGLSWYPPHSQQQEQRPLPPVPPALIEMPNQVPQRPVPMF
jgi:hypothetical protein